MISQTTTLLHILTLATFLHIVTCYSAWVKQINLFHVWVHKLHVLASPHHDAWHTTESTHHINNYKKLLPHKIDGVCMVVCRTRIVIPKVDVC